MIDIQDRTRLYSHLTHKGFSNDHFNILCDYLQDLDRTFPNVVDLCLDNIVFKYSICKNTGGLKVGDIYRDGIQVIGEKDDYLLVSILSLDYQEFAFSRAIEMYFTYIYRAKREFLNNDKLLAFTKDEAIDYDVESYHLDVIDTTYRFSFRQTSNEYIHLVLHLDTSCKTPKVSITVEVTDNRESVRDEVEGDMGISEAINYIKSKI